MANRLNWLIEDMGYRMKGLNAFWQTQAIDCSAAIELQKGSTAAVELQKGRKGKEEEKRRRVRGGCNYKGRKWKNCR